MWLAMLWACGSPPECGAAECAEVCATAPAPKKVEPAPAPAAPAKPAPVKGMSKFEQDVLGEVLQDVRGGVRSFSKEGVGICEGERTCDRFLGLDVGELAPGEYHLGATLRVPELPKGKEWKVRFRTECRTLRDGKMGEPNVYEKEYDVKWGGPDRGYNLRPLKGITSPATYATECTWALVSDHPDGDKELSGAWKVPAK